ncbi:MAG: trigger factor [Marinilabiliaceae bacterium]|nr:trigger factor [Marinilabiliaceae bacterium]
MNISKENVDELNVVLTLTIDKADYEPKVEESLKNYRKKVSMPGFRQGHVPAGLVKKMYGKQVLADEINKLMGESLQTYIKDNNLDIVGEPLPSEGQEPIDFDKEIDSISYKFDLGLKPAVELELNDKVKVPAYTIEISDKDVDSYIHDNVARLAQKVDAAKVGADSFVEGALEQAEGFKAENAYIGVRQIKDEAEAKKIKGAKVGDVVNIDLRKAFVEDSFISYILGITAEEAAKVNGEYALTINKISEYKDPELDQKVFDQILGEGVVSNVDDFKAKMKERIASNNALEEEYRFMLDLRETLLKSLKLSLPETFLRRWLTAVNVGNKEFSQEVLDKEFPNFLEDLKWQVVKNAILKKNDIKITPDDVLAFAKKSIKAQFAQYGIANIPEDKLEAYAQSQIRENKEQYEHMVEGASNDVVVKFAKEHVKLDSKNVKRDAFNKLFEKK